MHSIANYLKPSTTLLLFIGYYLQTVVGYLNVFINQKEMMKLMGLDAELFYVRNGVVNSYAMVFVVPVAADVYDLEFSWQSLTEYPLPYTITVEYESQLGGLLPPHLNIPTKGYVPTNQESFVIHLPCTGNVSEEVPVGINLLIKASPYFNDTRLNFKRNKICLKGVYPFLPAHAHAPTQGPALLGAAACALGLVLVIGLIASAMYVRARKQIRQDSLHTSFTTTVYGSHQNIHPFIRMDPLRPPSVNSGSYATIASLNKFPLTDTISKKSWFRRSPSPPTPYATAALLPPLTNSGNHRITTDSLYAKPESIITSRVSYYAASHLTQVYGVSTTQQSLHSNSNNTNQTTISMADPREKLREIGVTPEAITCHQLLREGTYGRIYRGTLITSQLKIINSNNNHTISSNNREIRDVLIKTVLDGASLTQVAFLLSEASILAGVFHPNVHSPCGVCLELPPQIAYPLPENGNFKLYLLNCRENNTAPNTRQLIEFGLQLAKGLAYLHSMGILHLDVATRNCVLDTDTVRICDSALSKDLFPDEYHCLGDNENRPIKWLALEALEKRQFSEASEIWSFGVLLWELITLAAMPYEEVDCFELEEYIRDGFRLEQPLNCPDEFFTVMSCCWQMDRNQRPKFSQLIAYLADFHEDLGKYI